MDARKPRPIVVIGLFVAASALISYLAAYAFTDALVKAEFFSPWAPGHDPRPRRFLIGFTSLSAAFGCFAAVMRMIGRNHHDRDETDESPENT